MPNVSPELQLEVQNFLFHEAVLLEETRFREWLALLTDDVRYVLPVRRNVQPKSGGGRNEPEETFALFNDDKPSLTMRVQRLETGIAHSEVPLSVTQRLITNVFAEAEAEAGFIAHSRFSVYQERGGRYGFTFYGKRRDRLRREGGSLRIAERRIELAQTILPTTISIFF
jgi:3-phenylpropionate/cinnamic acid dioxygenase small subunit